MSEPQPHVTTSCPQCSSALKIRRNYLGQTVACKRCGHSFLAAPAEEPTATSTGEHAVEAPALPSPRSERILVVCEKCKASLSVRSSRIGQVIRCKSCDREILVKNIRQTPPAPDGAAPGSTTADDLLGLSAGHGHDDEVHEALRSRSQQLQAELEQVRIAHNLLETELERLKPAYSLVAAENARLSDQVDRLSADRDALRTRADWISPMEARTWQEERVALRGEIEGLRQSLNAKEEWVSPMEARTWEEQQVALLGEIEELRQSLDLEQQNHRADVVRRSGELEQLSERHKQVQTQLDSTELACKEYQERNQELVQAQSRLESCHRSELDSARCRQAELEEQLRAELAKSAELVAQNLEPQTARPDQASVCSIRDDELQSARAEVLFLRRRVEELEHLQVEMRTALGGLGIRRYVNR
jgi:DNA-directed RNA polymerase subunit M/transcription elongation factor TFIIS